jgi:hypothetical protein
VKVVILSRLEAHLSSWRRRDLAAETREAVTKMLDCGVLIWIEDVAGHSYPSLPTPRSPARYPQLPQPIPPASTSIQVSEIIEFPHITSWRCWVDFSARKGVELLLVHLPLRVGGGEAIWLWAGQCSTSY